MADWDLVIQWWFYFWMAGLGLAVAIWSTIFGITYALRQWIDHGWGPGRL